MDTSACLATSLSVTTRPGFHSSATMYPLVRSGLTAPSPAPVLTLARAPASGPSSGSDDVLPCDRPYPARLPRPAPGRAEVLSSRSENVIPYGERRPVALRISICVAGGRSGPLTARELAAYAARAEHLGFHAIYFTDHFVHTGPTMHSGSAFAAIAAATQRIRLGFAAYVLPLRHPIAAARELATLDALCGGRLIAGLAAGSHAPEFEAFGIPFSERGARLDEGIGALRALWTAPAATHRGRFWHFEDIALDHKPVQQPHPPVWIGSWTGSPRAARRVAQHAAGWQASGLHTSVEEVRTGWGFIERACGETGRDPSTVGRAYVNAVTWLATGREEAWSEVAPRLREREDLRVIGTPDDAVAKLRRLEDAGIQEVGLLIQDRSLDQLDLIAREVMPAFASPTPPTQGRRGRRRRGSRVSPR
ncbi:MAG: TIGR03619 family F420-dependent LLM class oxidoreductase [Dehalococcoidia bacterium]|nr:TIGR03619 family F420-dependent LLM class oxidoreductase [Dehalococcoidia bacterium]